jgi:aspartate--ammonia ligase
MKLYFPENYKPKLDLKQTEKAIKFVKDFFQENLSAELRLRRVTAPLFVLKGTGINDDLNGVERAVTFAVKEMNDAKAEVVHSLAKWKRLMLGQYGIPAGYGIYTDMNAIRADEELTNIHSLYVDQWDWEKVLTAKQRNLDYLKKVVTQIYSVLLRCEFMVYENYPSIKPILPEEIHFVHSEELAQRFPKLTPKEREYEISKEFGAVFIIGIGGELPDGEKHDGRAPDYDDWTTENSAGY